MEKFTNTMKTIKAIVWETKNDKYNKFTTVERALQYANDTIEYIENDEMNLHDVQVSFNGFDDEGIARFTIEVL